MVLKLYSLESEKRIKKIGEKRKKAETVELQGNAQNVIANAGMDIKVLVLVLIIIWIVSFVYYVNLLKTIWDVVADTAVKDMADNANKMGTSMESNTKLLIQGFAKAPKLYNVR